MARSDSVVSSIRIASRELNVAESPSKNGKTSAEADGIARALSEYVAPLVHADGGELYLVSATADDVHVHLTGTCAGCPGSTMTRERLVEPAARAVAPKATIKVTTGPKVPDGAKKISP